MSKEELIEALNGLPLKDIAAILNKKFEALEVEDLPRLPDKFTVLGHTTAFQTIGSKWEEFSTSSVYRIQVVVKPVDAETILLKKGMHINGKELKSVELADDGFVYVTLARGKKLL